MQKSGFLKTRLISIRKIDTTRIEAKTTCVEAETTCIEAKTTCIEAKRPTSKDIHRLESSKQACTRTAENMANLDEDRGSAQKWSVSTLYTKHTAIVRHKQQI